MDDLGGVTPLSTWGRTHSSCTRQRVFGAVETPFPEAPEAHGSPAGSRGHGKESRYRGQPLLAASSVSRLVYPVMRPEGRESGAHAEPSAPAQGLRRAAPGPARSQPSLGLGPRTLRCHLPEVASHPPISLRPPLPIGSFHPSPLPAAPLPKRGAGLWDQLCRAGCAGDGQRGHQQDREGCGPEGSSCGRRFWKLHSEVENLRPHRISTAGGGTALVALMAGHRAPRGQSRRAPRGHLRRAPRGQPRRALGGHPRRDQRVSPGGTRGQPRRALGGSFQEGPGGSAQEDPEDPSQHEAQLAADSPGRVAEIDDPVT